MRDDHTYGLDWKGDGETGSPPGTGGPRTAMTKHRLEGADGKPSATIRERIGKGLVGLLVAGGFVLIPVALWFSASALIHAVGFSHRAKPAAGVLVSVRETKNCPTYGGCAYLWGSRAGQATEGTPRPRRMTWAAKSHVERCGPWQSWPLCVVGAEYSVHAGQRRAPANAGRS